MWVSAEFTGVTLIITTVAGIALGVYTANRQYKLADRIGHFSSTITMDISADRRSPRLRAGRHLGQ